MHEVIIGPNNSYILRIALPGFTKEQIDCEFVDGWIIVSASRAKENRISVESIFNTYKNKFCLGKDTKVDMVTLNNGILEILFSKDMATNGTKLRIN